MNVKSLQAPKSVAHIEKLTISAFVGVFTNNSDDSLLVKTPIKESDTGQQRKPR